MIQLQNVSIGYPENKSKVVVQQQLNLSATEGELIALIGPNGCGKSTLLRTMASLQPMLKGEIFIDNLNIHNLTTRKRAKLISVVLTEHESVASFTVRELVSIGRDPYTGWLGSLSPKDIEIIDRSMEMTKTSPFERRNIHELSDGERQRVFIARALAQDTKVILLDEPTSHLDLPNRINILRLLRNLARDTGKIIIISTHELETAMQVADKLWLMRKDDGVTVGTPEDLILNGKLNETFKDNSSSYIFDSLSGGFVIRQDSLREIVFIPSGRDEAVDRWTVKALERKGFVISQSAPVEVRTNNMTNEWEIVNRNNDIRVVASSIDILLKELNNLVIGKAHSL